VEFLAKATDTNLLAAGLEGLAPEGYEDGEGGLGTAPFNIQTGTILVEYNWYQTVSKQDEPREI